MRFCRGLGLIAIAGLLGLAVTDAQDAKDTYQARDVYQNVYAGWKWWHVYCFRCHGQDAIGSSTLKGPNLLESKFTRTEFLKMVRTGNPDKGMQAWNKLLDEKQMAQLYDYVRARADKVLPPGRPDEIGPNGGAWVVPENWPPKAQK